MKLEFVRRHDLDLDTLRAKVRERVAWYAQKYPQYDLASHHRWTSDRRVEGSYRGGHGVATLDEREARMTLDLPIFARIFRSKIEGFVERELDAVFGPKA